MTLSKYGLWNYGGGTGLYRPLTADTPTEAVVTKTVIKAIRTEFPDAFVLKIHGGAYQRAGVPDLYVLIHGKSVWIELKRPGSDTTALQKAKLEQLAAAGAFCGTAECSETAIAIISIAVKDKET